MRILLFLFLSIVWSCTSPDEKNKDLTFSPKELLTERCVEENCATVTITWPEAKETAVGKKVNDVILSKLKSYFRPDTVFADLKSATEDFVNSYVEFKNDFPEVSGDWNIEITVEKSYESDSLISFKFSEYNFSGGAHPNSSIMFLNFDKVNGYMLTEDQFILDREKLFEKTERSFREYHQVPNNTSLTEDGRFFLPETGFFLPNAIGYEDGKLLLIYIPYEIGPYALGYTELEFDLIELEGIVKK